MKKKLCFFRRAVSIGLSIALVMNSFTIPAGAEELTSGEAYTETYEVKVTPEEDLVFYDNTMEEMNIPQAESDEAVSESGELSDLGGMDVPEGELTGEEAGDLEEVGAAQEITSWSMLQAAFNDPSAYGEYKRIGSSGEKGYILTLGADLTAGASDTELSFSNTRFPVILEMNGHRLNRGLSGSARTYDNGSIIRVRQGQLTVRSSSGTGRLTGGAAMTGGAVKVDLGALCTLENLTIAGNKAISGGAVHAYTESNVTITGCTMEDNSAPQGGAVYSGGIVKINDCGIYSNEATYGAGLYIIGGTCNISGNTMISYNSNTTVKGGGIYLNTGDCILSDQVNIVNNTAKEAGGGVYIESGKLVQNAGRISGNEAPLGGGVYLETGTFNCSNSVMDNRASEGGGIYAASGNVDLTGAYVSGNRAESGGGIYLASGKCVIPGGSSRVVLGNTNSSQTKTTDIFLGGTDTVLTLSGDLRIDQKYNVSVSAEHQAGFTNGYTGQPNRVWAYFYNPDGLICCYDNGEAAFRKEHIPEAEWTWEGTKSAELTLDCKECGNSIVSGKKAVITGPTLDLDLKKVVYVATVEIKGEKYTDVKIAPDEEQPDTPVYTTWQELQQAFRDGGERVWNDSIGDWENVIRLYMDITAGSGDRMLYFEDFYYTGEPVILDLNGHKLDRNFNDLGNNEGAAICAGSGTLVIRDRIGGGTVTGGASYYGGGIRVEGGTVILESGSISRNTADAGGAVYVKSGTFRMTGGTLSGNTAQNGGNGIYVAGGTAEISGGKISGNESSGDGGAVCVNGGTAVINGGQIAFNKAGRGGALYLNNGTIQLSGGTISGNTSMIGGAVYVNGGRFELSGGPVISGNTSHSGADADIYFAGQYSEIVLTGKLAADAVYGISMEEGHSAILIRDYDYIQKDEPPTKHFVSEDPDLLVCMSGAHVTLREDHIPKAIWTWTDDYKAKVRLACAQCHTPYSEEVEAEVTGPVVDVEMRALVYIAKATIDDVEYTDVVKAKEQPKERIITSWQELQTALNELGDYVENKETGRRENLIRLYMDIAADENKGDTDLKYQNFDEANPVVLDLNGHTIDRNASGYGRNGNVIRIETGNLIIRDSAGDGKITGANGERSGAIHIEEGKLILESGSITGNSSRFNGAGVNLHRGSFIMNGGSITENKSEAGGGGVYMYEGTLQLSGGTISGNDGGAFGGGVYTDGGIITLGDTVITGNSASFGGAVCIWDGTFMISGHPQISGNMDPVKGTHSTIYLDGKSSVITIVGELSLAEGEKIGVSISPGHSPVITAGYDEYYGEVHPETIFASEDEKYLLCKGEGGKEAALVKEHSCEAAWEWEGYHKAVARMSCKNCGTFQWEAEADEITGPVYDPEKDAFVFTATLVKDETEYTDTITADEEYHKVEETEPTIGEDGGYNTGKIAHYEIVIEDTVYCFAINEDGTVGGRLTEEELALSWFVFNGNTVETYTGPVKEGSAPVITEPAEEEETPEDQKEDTQEEPEELPDAGDEDKEDGQEEKEQGSGSDVDPGLDGVFTINLPKYYTDADGNKVDVTQIGNGTGAFFICDKYAVACTENITAVSDGAFAGSGFAGFSGDTSGLTQIGSRAFANNKVSMTRLILMAQKPVTVGTGAFAGNSDPADVSGLTVYCMHASLLVPGEQGTGTDRYIVEYMDEHVLEVEHEKTVWAEEYVSATLTIRCTASTTCTEEHVIPDVPVTWEVRENDILYIAETEYEGKTYTDTVTGPKLAIVLAPGNGSGEAQTIETGYTYELPEEVPGFEAPEGEMKLTWVDLALKTYEPGETVSVKTGMTFTAKWVSTWAGVASRLVAGETVNLYNDIKPDQEDSYFEIPKGIKATLNLQGYTIDRGLSAPIPDGFIFHVYGELTLNGTGTITGGKNTGNGGAVLMEDGGKLYMNEVWLYANHAANGGGIFLVSGSYVKVTGKIYKDDSKINSKITHGSASQRGGGGYVSKNSTLRLEGILVERNTAGIEGGGIYVEKDGNLELKGDNKIKNNTGEDGKRDNTWVKDVVAIIIVGGIIGGLAYLGFNMFGPGAASAAAGSGAISLDGSNNTDTNKDEEEEKKKCKHTYKENFWIWDEVAYSTAEVSLVCTQCGTPAMANAVVTPSKSGDKYVYEAKAEKDGKTYTDKKEVDPYKVTLKSGYDSRTKEEKVAHMKNMPGTFILPSCPWTRDGYKFNGWEVEGTAGGSGIMPGIISGGGSGSSSPGQSAGTPIIVNSDTTVTAKWKEQVKINFEKGADDAQGSMSAVDVDKDSSYTLPSSGFTRDGYSFIGWKIVSENDPAPPAGGEDDPDIKKAGTPITMDENKTAYAQWKEDPKVTFGKNSEDAKLIEGKSDAAVHVKEGKEYTLPECMYERENYSFDGWKVVTDSGAPEPGGAGSAPAPAGEESGSYETKKAGEKITVNSDVRLVAQWKEDPKVSFDKGNENAKLKEGQKDDPVHVKMGKEYELPECMYEREGYTFNGWKVTRTDNAAPNPEYTPSEPEEQTKKPGEKITVTEDMTATATWKGKAVFKGHSLVLTGQIGVTFGIEFQENVKSDGSYMEFTVQGKTTRVNTSEAKTAKDGRKQYTCYLDALQMGETIKAVLHYEEDQESTQEYTVEKYIQFIDQHSSDYDQTTLEAVRAIADYGHHAQPFLSRLNHWTYGVDYATVNTCYTSSYNEQEVKNAVSGYKFTYDKGSSKLKNATYRLHLDYATALVITMNLTEPTDLTATAYFNGQTFSVQKVSDTTYELWIKGINASQLGEFISISGNAGGSFSVRVAALSYVRSMLNSEAYSKDVQAKNMVMALYYYYKKVMAYKNSH